MAKIQRICPAQRVIQDNRSGFGVKKFRIHRYSYGTARYPAGLSRSGTAGCECNTTTSCQTQTQPPPLPIQSRGRRSLPPLPHHITQNQSLHHPTALHKMQKPKLCAVLRFHLTPYCTASYDAIPSPPFSPLHLRLQLQWQCRVGFTP
ncbi:hypothetical protein L873DRAFT_838329 [Choiromyces venosus 120613-1]|uniref:Uncharacterized protein n=1 Tax=Choiromyces venosus 120613-1 TaxID=1336337 RepID=A0A3N4JPL8_9PEZI|nr:hypothetical protein L873DRAFT_838329 [Choiromyces venosus 120613-1]